MSRGTRVILLCIALFSGYAAASEQERMYSEAEVLEILVDAQKQIQLLEQQIIKQDQVITALTALLERGCEGILQAEASTGSNDTDKHEGEKR